MVERVPAVICDIKGIVNGHYVEMPGWDPNYVIVDDRLQVSRVNIIGVVTQAEADGNIARYTLDDSTDTITLRSYDSNALEAKPGELVIVIGRPRTYQNEIYLVPELIRGVDAAWATYRKKQLELLSAERASLPTIDVPDQSELEAAAKANDARPTSPEPTATAPASGGNSSSNDEEASDTERIYAMIETIDSGEGADLSDVLAEAQKSGIEQAEKAIHHMLEMGDIFEIRAGKLKVL